MLNLPEIPDKKTVVKSAAGFFLLGILSYLCMSVMPGCSYIYQISTALEWMVVSYYVSSGNGNQVLLKSKEQVLLRDKPPPQLLKSAFKKKTLS